MNKRIDMWQCVAMDNSDNHGLTMPTALMDVGHHFDEVPWNI
jgi:hypothetical protein